MQWIAPSEKDAGTAPLEKRLCDIVDQFRANSSRKSREYSPPARDVLVASPLDSGFAFSGFSSAMASLHLSKNSSEIPSQRATYNAPK
jgi:hypothetical protein